MHWAMVGTLCPTHFISRVIDLAVGKLTKLHHPSLFLHPSTYPEYLRDLKQYREHYQDLDWETGPRISISTRNHSDQGLSGAGLPLQEISSNTVQC